MTLTNRNSYPLPVGGLGGALSIDGVNVGELSSGDAGLLPAHGTRQLRVPFTVHLGAAAGAVRAIESGRATVRFNGRLHSGGAAVPIQFDRLLSFLH